MWVMLKLSPDVSIMFLNRFACSKQALELTLHETDEIKLHQFQVCQEPSLEPSHPFSTPGIPGIITVCHCVDQSLLVLLLVTCNRYRIFFFFFLWRYLVLPLYPSLAGDWQVLQHPQSSILLLDGLSSKANGFELNGPIEYLTPDPRRGI